MAFGKAYVNMADSAAENGASCCACSFAILLIILADIALAVSVLFSGLWAIRLCLCIFALVLPGMIIRIQAKNKADRKR